MPNKATDSTSRKDTYQQVTDTIIKQLEAGVMPWQPLWKGNSHGFQKLPVNGVTGRSYRGVNIVLLWSANLDKNFTSHEWASFKQWNSKNEKVRKGEKGTQIVYSDVFEVEEKDEIRKIPFLKLSYVFNRSQLESYKEEENMGEDSPAEVARIEDVELFVKNTSAIVDHHSDRAYYSISKDKIFVPEINSFIATEHASASENYYAVLLHELVHWTGHSSRLDRKQKNKFGSHAYAEEELIAELGAAFLCAEFNVSAEPKPEHAAYIANWLKILKDNKQFIVSAASEAIKAVDYACGLKL